VIALRRPAEVVIINHVRRLNNSTVTRGCRDHSRILQRGQVAQVVERSPEKAGVGGSTPSLATMFSTT
jgi:hypothetical protein